ncbi:hypothetical protein FKN04_22430 [Bacillus glycinifermentans]|uniref:hypothetical protein n=1 Tax=Bacillus glycinifermentans TaxID=1664069 RepID=UPI001583D7C3|nr:hypothetical protein [Bacillus glycinifermentans]NUJ19293.1 hypothetical protein [Bacillus glycinifermentans]
MPKYRKKPVEVEAFKLGFEKMPQWFKDHIKTGSLSWFFSYKGPYTEVTEEPGGFAVKAYEGDYIVKYENGDVKVMSPVVFKREFEKAPETTAAKANVTDFPEHTNTVDAGKLAVKGPSFEDWKKSLGKKKEEKEKRRELFNWLIDKALEHPDVQAQIDRSIEELTRKALEESNNFTLGISKEDAKAFFGFKK